MRYQHPRFWFQLTALWAFVEVTLGGLLHALRVPLTGVVVGGTAVAIISIIGKNSAYPWKDILRATVLVIIVKAGASPHSPLPAYIAVAFQGIIGALVFQLFKFNQLSVIVFSVVAMLESAIQKLLIMTILYGKSLWVAFNIFTRTTLDSFHINSEISGSQWLISIYVGIYLVWGIYLGFRIATLENRVDRLKQKWEHDYVNLAGIKDSMFWNVQRSRQLFWFIYLLILLLMTFIIAVLGDDKSNIFYVVFRSMGAIFLVFWVINPLFNFWIKKKTKSPGFKKEIQDITDQFSQLQVDYYRAIQLVSGRAYLPFKYIRAMELLIVVRIWDHQPKP